MRLYILKLKNKKLYYAARLTHVLMLDLDQFLHPEKHGKRRARHDLPHHISAARDHCTFDNQAYSRAIQRIEDIAAHIERIHFDAHGRAARSDEFIRYSFFLLHQALALIYRNLTAFRKRPLSPDVKIIANQARKNLQLARRQAAMDDADFIGNLKFDSIYIGLGRCFDCLEQYFDELSGIN